MTLKREKFSKKQYRQNKGIVKRHPIIFSVMAFIVIMGGFNAAFSDKKENNSNNDSSNVVQSSSSSEDSTSSSSEVESSSSSEVESSSSQVVNEPDSLKELKATISTPMPKENFLNIEQGVLDSAQYNDIDSNDQSKATQFKSRIDNLNTLVSNNNSLADSEKDHLTDSDFNTLKEYQTKLVTYLNSLHDYATTYQTDNPVIQKTDTSEDTRSEFQQELSDSKQTFDQAKKDWLNAYDSIMNS